MIANVRLRAQAAEETCLSVFSVQCIWTLNGFNRCATVLSVIRLQTPPGGAEGRVALLIIVVRCFSCVNQSPPASGSTSAWAQFATTLYGGETKVTELCGDVRLRLPNCAAM